jgi:hypothetical protein
MTMLKTATALSLILTLSGAALAEAPAPDVSGGMTLEFDVKRGNSDFGTHEIRFSEDEGDLIAEVSVRLRAGAGPITVFRYEHDSTERWRDGQLIQIYGNTLKDGDRFPFEGRAEGEAVVIEATNEDGQAETVEFPPEILPSSHWRPYPLDTGQILHTEHGTPMDVTIEYLGMDEIEADGGTISAHRYRLEGTLTADLWYDEDGHWAGCEFEARGQHIRYVRRAAPSA